MVKTNNISQIQNNKKLSIQVALNGLSFCCKDLITNEIFDFGEFSFQEFPKTNTIEENLWKVFSENKALIAHYEEVRVLHQNNLNTWVPKPLFNENQLGSYLQYNNKVFPTDFFAFDTLPNYDLVNVYVPYVNITNFLLDQFKEFEYQHSSTILVQELLKINNEKGTSRVYIHFEQHQFQLVVLEQDKLIFYNTFDFQTENDVLYYLLFVAEQLSLDPDQFELYVLGKMTTEHAIFEKMYQFVRNVQMLSVDDLKQKFGRKEAENIANFVLFHL